MPRQARVDFPGSLHHIICRGIEGSDIYWSDEDRDDFLCRFIELVAKTSTKCYAWALLPNHFHLLLQTGLLPLSNVMQRLLTGYATAFNLRHQRHGHLFQNRYKSILCQQDRYLLELIRYIHLNPVRAGIVDSYEGLERYRYCGHRCLLEFEKDAPSWMSIENTLQAFGDSRQKSIERYEEFLRGGLNEGHRSDLVGGGLLRSAGGWREVQAAREAGVFLKSDERILGDSDFVDSVLRTCEEDIDRKSKYSRNLGIDELIVVVARTLHLEEHDVRGAGKHPYQVQARNLLCYWGVTELGMTATEVAKALGICQSTATMAVSRGKTLAQEKRWYLPELLEIDS